MTLSPTMTLERDREMYRSVSRRWSLCTHNLCEAFELDEADPPQAIRLEFSPTPAAGFLQFKLKGRLLKGVPFGCVYIARRSRPYATTSNVPAFAALIVGFKMTGELTTSKPHYVKLHVNPEERGS